MDKPLKGKNVNDTKYGYYEMQNWVSGIYARCKKLFKQAYTCENLIFVGQKTK